MDGISRKGSRNFDQQKEVHSRKDFEEKIAAMKNQKNTDEKPKKTTKIIENRENRRRIIKKINIMKR